MGKTEIRGKEILGVYYWRRSGILLTFWPFLDANLGLEVRGPNGFVIVEQVLRGLHIFRR